MNMDSETQADFDEYLDGEEYPAQPDFDEKARQMIAMGGEVTLG